MVEKVIKVYKDAGYEINNSLEKNITKVVKLLKIYEDAGCEIDYALITHIIYLVEQKEKYKGRITAFIKEGLSGNKMAQKVVVDFYEDKVITVASKYINKGYEFEELINEGILKLYDGFDGKKSAGFFEHIIQSLNSFYRSLTKENEKEIDLESAYRNLDPHEKKKYIDDAIMDYTSNEEDIISRIDAKRVVPYLKMLPELHQRIIKKRYGLNDQKEMTFDEIGKEEGFTTERIRQIISDDLVKIYRKILHDDSVKANKAQIEVNLVNKAKTDQIKRERRIDNKYKVLIIKGLFKAFFESLKFDILEATMLFHEIDIDTKEKLLDEIENYPESGKTAEQIKKEYSEVFKKLEDIKQNIDNSRKQAAVLKSVREKEFLELVDFISTHEFPVEEITDIEIKLLVTKLYFGLIAGKIHTIESISSFLGLSQEEVEDYIYEIVNYCNEMNNGLFSTYISCSELHGDDKKGPTTI